MLVEDGRERGRVLIFPCVEIQMKHGVLRPLPFQTLHRKPREQLLPPLEVGLQRGDQQALAETPRTAQKIILPRAQQFIDQSGLVHIRVAALADFGKTLDSYRINHAHNGKDWMVRLQS